MPQSWWPIPSTGGGGSVGVRGGGLGLLEPASAGGARARKGARGRNDGNYKFSHTDHPAHPYILSLSCAPPSGLHLHPKTIQKVHRNGELMLDLSLCRPTHKPLAMGTCDY